MRSLVTLTLLVVFIALAASASAYQQHKKVLLTEVKKLVLREGRMTTGRRGSPVPQLERRSGPAAGVTEVVCSNEGHDGMDVIVRSS